MQIINENSISSGKVAVIFNFIENRGKLTQYIKHMKEHNINVNEILWVSLFDFNLKKPSVGDVRKGVIELEESLKSTSVNVVIDMTSSYDIKQQKYVKGLMFKNIFGLDSSKWLKLGVYTGKLSNEALDRKFICGLRWESIAREKDSYSIIDSEFLAKESQMNLVDVRNEKGLRDIANFLKSTKEVSLDIETNMVDFAHKDFKILCIQYGRPDKPYDSYVAWYDKTGVTTTDKYREMFVKLIKWCFEKKIVIAHNGCQFDFPALCLQFDIDPMECNFHDTLITHYIALNSTIRPKLDLKSLSYPIMGEYEHSLDTFKDKYCKENKIKKADFSYDLIPEDVLFEYSAKDIVAMNFIRKQGEDLCRNHIAGDVYDVAWTNYYRELSKIIVDMVVEGIPFEWRKAQVELEGLQKDLQRLNTKILEDESIKMTEKRLAKIQLAKAEKEYQGKVDKALKAGKVFKGKPVNPEAESYGTVKELRPKFNFNSKAHMGVLLFDVLKCKSLKETATGTPSTDSETTMKLAEMYPNISFLKYFKEIALLSKEIDSFFVPYIEKAKNSIDGKIRGVIQANGTQSGRFSMRDVNLMQLPKKSSLKKYMTLDPEGEYCYIYADFASLETFVAGLESNSDEIINMLKIAPEDSHSYLFLGMNQKEFPNLDRTKAEDRRYIKDNYSERRDGQKTKVFQLIYGASEYGIANGFGISVEEAKAFYDSYWETNWELSDFYRGVEQKAKKDGYVILSEGQPLLTPNADSSDVKLAKADSRSYCNSVLQCFASKTNRGMIATTKWCKDNGFFIKNVLQTHDSGILKVKKNEALLIAKNFKQELERDYKVNQRISLVADPELCYNVKGGYVLEGDNWETLVDDFFENKIKQRVL